MSILRKIKAELRHAQMRRRNCLVIFNWHQVTPVFDPERHHKGIWTSLESFNQAIDYLQNDFKVASLAGAIDALEANKLKGVTVALTFDDGDVSLEKFVLPLLQERELPATFFVNSAYFDRRHYGWSWILPAALRARDRGALPPAIDPELLQAASELRTIRDPKIYNDLREKIEALGPYFPEAMPELVRLDWLRSLDPSQFTIGLHGHEHQRFGLMPLQWQENDLRQNLAILEQFTAFKKIFAVPFGRPWDWSPGTLQAAQSLGLKVFLANGGLNTVALPAYFRNPADSQDVGALMCEALAA